jgi:hypothetical protein
MDTQQRQMWDRMLDEVGQCQRGELELGQLVTDLRGLFVEADPHALAVREQFEGSSDLTGSDRLEQ